MLKHIALVALALGCGCESFGVLAPKPPISEDGELAMRRACTSRGIKGCPDLVDGVLDYFKGDRWLEDAKMANAVKENDPRPLAGFLDALEVLGTEYSVQKMDVIIADARRQLARKVSGTVLAIPRPPTTAPFSSGQPPTATEAPSQPIAERLQELFECSDESCEKYRSIKHAIVCLDEGCSRWHWIEKGHEADSRH
jgi:hypothetical protein